MAEKNQMISRLKNEGQRIHAMVSPWSRSYLPDSKILGHLPETNPAFGIRSRNAAKKMRFLYPENQGSIQPESLLHQAKIIKDRTSQYHRLLHLNPKVSRDSGLWSKIEQDLPSGAAPESVSPPEPGVLQQGSIIPKMSMFPAKGQPFSEFKSQIQSSEMLRPKPAAQVDKKPRVLPNSRIFARVQELTGKEPQEKQGSDDSETGEMPAQPPAAQDTIRRQVKAPEMPPARQVPPPSTRMENKPVLKRQDQEPESKIIPQPPTIQQPAVSMTEQTGKVIAAPIESAPDQPSPLRDEKIPPLKGDVPVQIESKPARMEPRTSQQPESLPLRLPLARPVTKKTEQSVLKAKSVPLTSAKTTMGSARQQSEKISLPLTRPAAAGTMGGVVQRQVEHKIPVQGQKQAADAVPAEHHTGFKDKPVSKDLHPGGSSSEIADQSPVVDAFRPEQSDLARPVSNEKSAQSVIHSDTGRTQSGSNLQDNDSSVSTFHRPPEMILQKRLEAKKKPPLLINSVDAQQFQEVKKLRGAAQVLVKLFRPGKKMSSLAGEADTRSNLPKTVGQGVPQQTLQSSTAMPVFSQQTNGMENKTSPVQPSRELFSAHVPDYDRLAMDLPRPPKIVWSSKPSPSQPVNTEKKQPAEAPEPVNNDKSQVVQRSLDNPMENVQNAVGKVQNKVMGKLGLGGGGGGKSEEKGGGSGGGNSPDLEKLAEDVFPLIKRLLEIEKDRISGLLR